MIDENVFYKFIKMALELDSLQKNSMYHQISEIIKDNAVSDPAAEIVLAFEQFLKDRANEISYQATERSEGRIPGALFRRVG